MNEENIIKDYEEYKKVFIKYLNETENKNLEDVCRISFAILQDENCKLIKQFEKENCKNKKTKTKKKNAKFDKRIENKICKLILTYRKTSNEIKQIILEENKIKISDRDLLNIKKKNNIKGHSIVD
ncbi:MAG: hypothetical protein E6Z74_15830 [Clostridium perfringens]|nr:hypothetical protein [Clostridium perfringens]